ncbi:DUF305 domain-containing protein [Domibacillus enclensis]|uniref:DUF305 domain-containing protein n=1 Tax=Domibacillus enclensis TaxID=1017273 RepID=A0A1N6VYQ1_9BACI|nr:DUF305 domain-containing protein [Domibacillus enclensis]OXS77800.1 DUF305 domain-containing protein [Domibacillus enclensis]SIQ82944.1 protein of unknown function [Domibacillus enclensis]
MNKYAKFGVMIAVSTILMYAFMYFNVFQLDHIFFSETRVYMALMMGSVMAIVMLVFMWNMYDKRRLNTLILAGSAAVLVLSIWLMRSQSTVEDVSWMKAMIPHHSIAILTSERANISDPRVKELANSIIEAQRREIDEMKKLIEELEEQK